MRNQFGEPTTKASVLSEGVYDLRELEERVSKPSRWVMAGSLIYRTVTVSHDQLPSGVYDITIDRNNGDPLFLKREVKTDELVSIPGGVVENTLKEIADFWLSADKFHKHGMLHRRGYILYGAQGTGKSSALNLLIEGVTKQDGVVFICTNPSYLRQALAAFRAVEPKRPVVCIYEDIDAIIKTHGEAELLGILDGTNQIDGVLNIATTNYPELLDKRLISRPRRFDRALKIMPPVTNERRSYFKAKGFKAEELDAFTEATEGLSFASLAEVIIGTQCLSHPLTEIVETLKDLETRQYKNEEETKTGFTPTEKDED